MPQSDGSVESPAEAASSSLPASQLPWQQIPSFDPQTTDLQVYTRKLQFLKDIWPMEHISQLAPRAALQVQGVAFQKVARLEASKLRSEAGVQYLVESLGGQWGKLASEEKLSLFEKALYQTSQKSDESNDSYLARHDAAFEDMLATGVKMEEIRAYVLLRQSQLPPEDRKRIIVDTKGELTYDGARKALRLLGAKFFQDLQNGTKTNRYKTYDINTAESLDETAMLTTENEVYDEDALVQFLHESGDEDAAFILDFEESVIDAVQESPELASCYTTYLEARTRLKERAKFRGFWAPSSSGKGKGKRPKGGVGKGQPGFRPRSLAERIATSACKRCGQVGHWKRECPLSNTKGESKGKGITGETITLAEALVTFPTHVEDPFNETDIEEMPMTLPDNAEIIGLKELPKELEWVAVHLCAMEPQNYLETELSGEEDPGLQSNQTYMNAPEQTYKVPPGVKTLSQWGQQVIPSGKKAGMTFTQVFDQDDGYCMQVKSRKAVAPWLRSFQNYLTARWKHRMLHQFPVKPQVNPTPKSSRTPTSQEKITKGYKITDQEWETVETPKASPLKRGTSEMNQGASSSSAMKTEPNIDKVEKIRAQIAILQRELARETQVPADDL
eukprot:s399_g7.t2